MALFIRKTETKELPELNAETAESIYNLLAAGKSETQIFIENGIDFEYTKQVWQEIKLIEKQVNTIMGTIPQPADQSALVSQVTAVLLDKAIVVDDIRKWADGTPDDEPAYDTWKATYTEGV